MILPSKHVQPERALIGVGAEILGALTKPMTMSLHMGRNPGVAELLLLPRLRWTSEWFVLALDFLYSIGAVEL